MSQIQSKPLISVLVVCYNNQKYIRQTLQSIFDQTYPNIEIIIGDDASQDFDASALIRWINYTKTENINRIVICENNENLGTVANIENLQKKSTGEFLFHIAADDALHNPTVLEKAYELAEQIGPSAEMIVGQTELWDITLTQKLDDWTTPEREAFIKKATPQELFTESSCYAILPASYLYRRSMLQKVGKLSDRYRLVEDWPTHLRVTRQGVKPLFLDGVPLIKHRDGGISHGNSLHSKKTFLTYYSDCLKAYYYEVVPHQEMLIESERERSKTLFTDRTRAYYAIHVPEYYKALAEENVAKEMMASSEEERIAQIAVVAEAKAKAKITEEEETKAKARRERIKNILFRASRKKMIICTALLAVLFAIAVVFTTQLNGFIKNVMCFVLADVSLLFLLVAAAQLGINLIFKIRKAMWEGTGTGKMLKRIEVMKHCLFSVSRKKPVGCTCVLFVLSSVMTIVASQISSSFWGVLCIVFGVLSLVLLLMLAVEVAANILFKLWKKMQSRGNSGVS